MSRVIKDVNVVLELTIRFKKLCRSELSGISSVITRFHDLVHCYNYDKRRVVITIPLYSRDIMLLEVLTYLNESFKGLVQDYDYKTVCETVSDNSVVTEVGFVNEEVVNKGIKGIIRATF
jgi:hypothetical protein